MSRIDMSNATCPVAKCPNPVRDGGLCNGHYKRLRRHGDVQAHISMPPEPFKECSVDGCTQQGRWRGWCRKHYDRWKRHGDPTFSLTIYRDDERRFWSKVRKDGSVPASKPELGPCWPWTGFTDRGYGRFNVGSNGFVQAHRWSYERTVRELMPALSLCDQVDLWRYGRLAGLAVLG